MATENDKPNQENQDQDQDFNPFKTVERQATDDADDDLDDSDDEDEDEDQDDEDQDNDEDSDEDQDKDETDEDDSDDEDEDEDDEDEDSKDDEDEDQDDEDKDADKKKDKGGKQADVNDVLKKELGFDSIEQAKEQIENLRKPKEPEFANDESKKLYELIRAGKQDEVYQLLHTKQTLSNVDKLTSEEVIKLQLKLSKPNWTDADVQDVFEEKYSLPEEPVQRADEDDDDFEDRMDKWKEKVEKAKRRLDREAADARTQLAEFNKELVLPDIQIAAAGGDPSAGQKGLTTEEAKQMHKQFVEALESNFKNFSGFKVEFKDKDVSLPIAFNISEEEKPALKEALKGFNMEQFFSQRWLQDGKFNVEQMAEDYYLLLNRDKIFRKLVNEAGRQRLSHHIKKSKNSRINTGGGGNENVPHETKKEGKKKKSTGNEAAAFFFSK